MVSDDVRLTRLTRAVTMVGLLHHEGPIPESSEYAHARAAMLLGWRKISESLLGQKLRRGV